MTEPRNKIYNNLRVNKLFLTVPSEQLSTLVKYFKILFFRNGEYIYKKNNRDNMFYLICNGRIKLSVPRENKQEQTLSILKEGDYFGEIELLTESSRVTQAKALTDVELFSADHNTFLILLQECHIASLNLVKDLSKKTMQIINNIS